jgi:DinB superfamily
MDRHQLSEQLEHHHRAFTTLLSDLTPAQLDAIVANKWNAYQQIEHIIKSVSPVNTAFLLPLFLLGLLFGKANRNSKSYDELVAKYHLKLIEGGRAASRFVPGGKEKNIQVLTNQLLRLVHSLQHKIRSRKEAELDLYILPHPLLGKLTLREMIYFTIYHVQHHQKQVENQLC